MGDDSEGDGNDDDDQEPLGMADSMMLRGSQLRRLRMLAEADESERRAQQSPDGCSTGVGDLNNPDVGEDQIDILPDGRTVLRYDSYLYHQRYYDDLKHVDVSFVDYGIVGGDVGGGGRLIVEQRKDLGKGGLCWDAAFILAEHLIATEGDWKVRTNQSTTRIVELGSGTGVCGLMLAKAVRDSQVYITDLPELSGLMTRNLTLNFEADSIVPALQPTTEINENDATCGDGKDGRTEAVCSSSTTTYGLSAGALYSTKNLDDVKKSAGHATATVLRWGVEDDYRDRPFDVVIGADVVASLYDPTALARTIHSLCDRHTKVFVSYKGRLTGPHETFESTLRDLFGTVERIRPVSRNKNPDVWILRVEGKVDLLNE